MEHDYYIQQVDLSKYEKKNSIGSGSYGKVFKIQSKETKKYYAAKVLVLNKENYTEDKKDFFKYIQRELGLLDQIKHPCILRFHGFCNHDFDGNHFPTIITEYEKNDTLFAMLRLKKKGKAPSEFDDTIKYIVMYGIARGMEFLHQKKVIHRDLKSVNILLNKDFFPIIADFGLAKITDPDHPTYQSTSCGTLIYQAPEILTGDKFSYPVDVYAYSIILYEISTELIPYGKISNTNCLHSLVPGNFRPEFPPEGIDDDMKSLIEECWDKDPDKRPNFTSIVHTLQNESFAKRMNVDLDRFKAYVDFLNKSEKQFASEPSIFYSYAEVNKHINQEMGDVYSLNENSDLPIECQKMLEKANNGDNGSMFDIAKSYLEGLKGFEKSEEKGIQYLNKAKAMGNVEASLVLGDIYFQRKEYDSSIECLDLPVVRDNPKAKLIMAKIELTKENPDYKMIKKHLTEASLGSNVEAMVLYGKLFMKNYKESFRYFQTAAKMKDPEALAYLSLFYYYGYKIVDFDFKQAAELSYQSYSEGNMTGAAFYSECLARGRGVEKNEELAVSIARESSESKNSKGMNKYGLFLNQGIGNLSPNKKEAARLWKMSSESGDAEGKFLYGSCLLEGGEYEVEKNPKKAIKYLEESIEGGCITAMAVLGQLKVCGHFVEQDNYNGIEMIEEAADLGDDYAIIIYSHFLARGIGTSVNYEKARNYLKIGMERNNSDCFRLYGELIAQGTVPFVDPAKGIELIEKADKMELDESELEKKQQKQKLLDEYEKNRLEEEKDDEIGTEYYSGCNVCLY